MLLFGQNVGTPTRSRELTSTLHAARPGVLITSDEEGGDVTRLDGGTGSPWPGHATLGALDDPDATARVAAGLGATRPRRSASTSCWRRWSTWAPSPTTR